MKRVLALLLALVMLSGCRGQPAAPSELTLYPAPKNMEVRQLLGTGEDLLVCSTDRLVLLSGSELSVLAEREGFSDLAYVQVLEDAISVADPETKTVTLLGQSLEVLKTTQLDAPEKTWLVRSDGTEVYTLSADGMTAWDLNTGASRELLRCRYMTVLGISGGSVWLACLGETDIQNHWYRLDLTTGSLTELEGKSLLAIQNGLSLQDDGSYLCVRDGTAHWYDENGGFLSACALPEGVRLLTADFVRDEERGGWFFPVAGEAGCQLLFWKPVPGQGESLDLTGEQVPEGEVLPRELYDRAAELSERFGLDIRIADQAIRDYKGYDSGMLTDPELTAQALDILEGALSVYPEGFFEQLKYGNRRSVRIELVDWLKGKDGHDVSSGTSAFTVRLDQYCMIVLNARRIRNSAIFHEFSHIIDDRMAFEARLRPEALYSEEGWLALQPEGFRYADSYRDIPEEVTAFYDSGYFARNYSCVSATEDRAVTMEKAMMLEREVFEANPHLLPKLQYYCDCIRDSFDTSGWPETLPWEQLLR